MKNENLENEIYELKSQLQEMQKREKDRKENLKKFLKVSAIGLCLTFSGYGIAVIASLHIFSAGEVISAQRINENFVYLESQINSSNGGPAAKMGMTTIPWGWTTRIGTDGTFDSNSGNYLGEEFITFDNFEIDDGNVFDHANGFTYYQAPTAGWYKMYLNNLIDVTIDLSGSKTLYESDPFGAYTSFQDSYANVNVQFYVAELDGGNNVINESEGHWLGSSDSNYYDNDANGTIETTEEYTYMNNYQEEEIYLEAGQIVFFKLRYEFRHNETGNSIALTPNSNGRLVIRRINI